MVFSERPSHTPSLPIVLSHESLEEIRRLCLRSEPVDPQSLVEDEEAWEEIYLENERNQVTLHVLPNRTVISLSQEIDNENFSTQYDIAVRGGEVVYEHRDSHFELDPRVGDIQRVFEKLPGEMEIESIWGFMEVEAQELRAIIELRFANRLKIQWSAERMSPNDDVEKKISFGKGSGSFTRVNQDEKVVLEERQKYFDFDFSLNNDETGNHNPIMSIQVNDSDWMLEAKFGKVNLRAVENLPSMFRPGVNVRPVQLVPLTVSVKKR